MVSFRFHLVSLVAVFLALGVGVLTGTTVINRGVVAQLESRTDDLSADFETLRGEFEELQAEAEVWSVFGEQAMGPLLSGRLADRQIVVVTQDGTSGEAVAGVQRALEAAGAQVVASLSAGARLALNGEADRAALAAVLGAEADAEPEALAADAAAAIALRLTQGPNGTDVLERLLADDFLVIQGSGLGEEGLRAVGGPEQAVVVIAGGPAPSDLAPAGFLVPLVTDLAASGVPVAAAEPVEVGEQEPPFVATLRGQTEIAPMLATQDNVDQLPGQVGLVLAIEDLLQGKPGHYGVKGGAPAVLPDLA